MVEGILSACYHICPTHANYQFGELALFCTCIDLFPRTSAGQELPEIRERNSANIHKFQSN